MGRAADLYARVSPLLAGLPGATLATRAHARLLARGGERLRARFLGVPTLVLRTVGRRSGKPRESPMFYLRHGDALAVVASNAAATRTPAWFLNLEADPEAEAYVDGEWRPVRGRRATEAEERELWPRFAAMYSGYDRYRRMATRELPVVILEPR